MNADSLMARYWLEHERRLRGEHCGLRAMAPTLSGIVSECHGAKVTGNRYGELLCTECQGVCDGQSWHAARAQSQQGDGIRTMIVRETRSVARDRSDSLRAREADRYLEHARLEALIKPRPFWCEQGRWTHTLHAYGWYVLIGSADLVAERGLQYEPRMGPWSASSVRRAVELGRDVLSRRYQRPRTKAWQQMMVRVA